jgi:hypothetical protein
VEVVGIVEVFFQYLRKKRPKTEEEEQQKKDNLLEQNSHPRAESSQGMILQEQQLNHNSSVVYSCRYCGNFETDIEEDYKRHIIKIHPGKLCYPSKADLDMYNGNTRKR